MATFMSKLDLPAAIRVPRMRRTPCVGHSSRHWFYKLTCTDFDQLLKRSKGRCELCRDSARRVVFDHDHVLGLWAVRGLLCYSCNQDVIVLERVQRNPHPLPLYSGEQRRYLAKSFYFRLARYGDLVPPEMLAHQKLRF